MRMLDEDRATLTVWRHGGLENAGRVRRRSGGSARADAMRAELGRKRPVVLLRVLQHCLHGSARMGRLERLDSEQGERRVQPCTLALTNSLVCLPLQSVITPQSNDSLIVRPINRAHGLAIAVHHVDRSVVNDRRQTLGSIGLNSGRSRRGNRRV